MTAGTLENRSPQSLFTPGRKLRVLDAKLDGGFLCYRTDGELEQGSPHNALAALLKAKRPEHFLEVLRRYGPMERCEQATWLRGAACGRCAFCTADPRKVPLPEPAWYREPLRLWQRLQATTLALFSIVHELRGEPKKRVFSGQHKHWQLLEEAGLIEPWWHIYADPEKPARELLLPVLRGAAGLAVTRFAELVGDLRPVLLWDRERPTFVLSGERFFRAAVAAQLFEQAVGNFALCSYCSKLFLPERAPRFDRRAFCPQCRAQGIPQRLARADYRRRKRQSW